MSYNIKFVKNGQLSILKGAVNKIETQKALVDDT